MKISIKPAISVSARHALEDALRKEEAETSMIVDGGETMMDGSESSIYLYPASE